MKTITVDVRKLVQNVHLFVDVKIVPTKKLFLVKIKYKTFTNHVRERRTKLLLILKLKGTNKSFIKLIKKMQVI